MIRRFPRLQPLLINIRGTNGSGKSHIVFRLMEMYGSEPIKNKDGRVWAYKLNSSPSIYILGRYETDCGGCDSIPTMDILISMAKELGKHGGDVICEGLLMSGLVSKPIALAAALKSHKTIFACLDTPLDICIERTVARRKKRGTTKEFNPAHLKVKYQAVISSRKNLESQGYDCRTLDHKDAVSQVISWRKLHYDRFRSRFPRLRQKG